jgi:hypothetical protein
VGGKVLKSHRLDELQKARVAWYMRYRCAGVRRTAIRGVTIPLLVALAATLAYPAARAQHHGVVETTPEGRYTPRLGNTRSATRSSGSRRPRITGELAETQGLKLADVDMPESLRAGHVNGVRSPGFGGCSPSMILPA